LLKCSAPPPFRFQATIGYDASGAVCCHRAAD